jgi:hypothetical protein
LRSNTLSVPQKSIAIANRNGGAQNTVLAQPSRKLIEASRVADSSGRHIETFQAACVASMPQLDRTSLPKAGE